MMRRILNYWLDALAVGGSVIGSLFVASNTGTTWIGYVCFLVGSSASVVLLRRSNVNRSLVYLNFYYMIINTFGLIRYW